MKVGGDEAKSFPPTRGMQHGARISPPNGSTVLNSEASLADRFPHKCLQSPDIRSIDSNKNVRTIVKTSRLSGGTYSFNSTCKGEMNLWQTQEV
jgi:hypothetical protein